MTADPVAIARNLVRCRSVTPEDGGALAYLQGVLAKAGFDVHRVTFAEPGTAPIENLYARIGSEKPNLVFAGHTDVVPAGNEAAWRHPPFAGEVADDMLYGRGAVDMKGGIACFVAAATDYLEANGGKPKRGSISLLITGDEESIAVNGTVSCCNGRPSAAKNSTIAFSASRAMSKCSATPLRRAAAARSTARSSSPGGRAMSPIRIAPTIRSAGW